MRATKTITLTTVALAITLASCSPNEPAPEPAPTTVATQTPEAPLPTPTDGAGDVGLEDDPQPLPTASWDAEAAVTAEDAATATVTAFLRTDLDSAQWSAELEAHVTSDLHQVLIDVDPANIIGTGPTGPAVLEGENISPFVAVVRVPTDGGDLLVTLTRAGDGLTWLASAIDQA